MPIVETLASYDTTMTFAHPSLKKPNLHWRSRVTGIPPNHSYSLSQMFKKWIHPSAPSRLFSLWYTCELSWCAPVLKAVNEVPEALPCDLAILTPLLLRNTLTAGVHRGTAWPEARMVTIATQSITLFGRCHLHAGTDSTTCPLLPRPKLRVQDDKYILQAHSIQ